MANTIISKANAWIQHKKKQARIRATLGELRKQEDKDLTKFSDLLGPVVSDRGWSTEEFACFDRITSIRNEYMGSNRTVAITDFGAGDPHSTRSKEAMEAGVRASRTLSQIYSITSTPGRWGKLIFKIVRTFQPMHCLELGTSVGISAAYQVLALKLNGRGKLTTIEGSEEIAGIARGTLASLDYPGFTVRTGRFKDVLPEVLSSQDPIDLAFIDGHHDKVATKEYFEALYPFLADRAVLIFDDIAWSDGMKEVWTLIREDDRIKVSLDLTKWGVCLVDKKFKGVKPPTYRIEF